MFETFTTAKDIGSSIYTTITKPRKLTLGEITMCKKIFGNAIVYDKVLIYNNKFITRAFGILGTLAYPSISIKNDYSLADPRSQAIFIHEMTHIWQYQQGYDVFKIGAIMQGFYLNSKFNPYRYELGYQFTEYNMESQAELLSDYYAIKYIGGENGTIALGFNKKNPLASSSAFLYLYSTKEGIENRRILFAIVESFINSKKDKALLPSEISLKNPAWLGHIRVEG